MPKTYAIGIEEAMKIRAKMKKVKSTTAYRRLEVVALRGEGKNNGEIAKITKYNEKSVSRIISDYMKKGIEALETNHRGGFNKRYLSYEEEAAMLKEFAKQAKRGQNITAKTIKKRYEELTGREQKSYGQIYNVLNRHDWRKMIPKKSARKNKRRVYRSKKINNYCRQ